MAALLQRLWTATTDAYPFRPLQMMCDAWAAEFGEKLTTSASLMDPGLTRAGIELFHSLPATAERQILLCTDLHAGNVLAAQREPWLAIDPKTVRGRPDLRCAATPAQLRGTAGCRPGWVGHPASRSPRPRP